MTLNPTTRQVLDERLRFARGELESARRHEKEMAERFGQAQRNRVDLDGIIAALQRTLDDDDKARATPHCPECTLDDDPLSWCECPPAVVEVRPHNGPCRLFAHDPANCPSLEGHLTVAASEPSRLEGVLSVLENAYRDARSRGRHSEARALQDDRAWLMRTVKR